MAIDSNFFNGPLYDDFFSKKSDIGTDLEEIKKELEPLTRSANKCDQLLGRLRLPCCPGSEIDIEKDYWDFFEFAGRHEKKYKKTMTIHLNYLFPMQAVSERQPECYQRFIGFLIETLKENFSFSERWKLHLLQTRKTATQKMREAKQAPDELFIEMIHAQLNELAQACANEKDPHERLGCAIQSSFFQHLIKNRQTAGPEADKFFQISVKKNIPIQDKKIKELFYHPFILNWLTRFVEATLTIRQRQELACPSQSSASLRNVYKLLDPQKNEISRKLLGLSELQGWELINRLNDPDEQMNWELENKCREFLLKAALHGCRDHCYIDLINYMRNR